MNREDVLNLIRRRERFCVTFVGRTLTHNGRGHLVLNFPDRSQESTTHAITRPDLAEHIVGRFLEGV